MSGGKRMRLLVCDGCGLKLRGSRGPLANAGLPACGCGHGTMRFDDVEDQAIVAPDGLYAHPDAVEEAERELRRAVREVSSSGRTHRCGGCQKWIRAVNEHCGC